jgi:hypothetical protein
MEKVVADKASHREEEVEEEEEEDDDNDDDDPGCASDPMGMVRVPLVLEPTWPTPQ